MAFTPENQIPTTLSVTQRLDCAVGYAPQTAVPLDILGYFEDYTEAVSAASIAVIAGSSDARYYIGQHLNVYNRTAGTVKTYYISPERTLVELPDEKTIGDNFVWLSGNNTAARNHLVCGNNELSGNNHFIYGQTDISAAQVSDYFYFGTPDSGLSAVKSTATLSSNMFDFTLMNADVANGMGELKSKNYSHAEGNSTSALAYCSHAEGCSTIAKMPYSHAEGFETMAGDPTSMITAGQANHAEGYQTSAFGGSANHAEGYKTYANSAYAAHAEGMETSATGWAAHADGVSAVVSSWYAYGWNGDTGVIYKDHGQGTFNLNPVGGLKGIYVGDKTLSGIISAEISAVSSLLELSANGISSVVKALSTGLSTEISSLELSVNGISSIVNSLSTGLSTKLSNLELSTNGISGVVKALSTGLSTELSNLELSVSGISSITNSLSTGLSTAIDAKVWVRDPEATSTPMSAGANTDLSIIKLTETEYGAIASDPTLSAQLNDGNKLYIISADYINAYGESIRNLVLPADATEDYAATKGYVDTTASQTSGALELSVGGLSNYVNLLALSANGISGVVSALELSTNGISAVVKSLSSDLSDAINSKLWIYDPAAIASPVSAGAASNLSVIKIDKDSYDEIIADSTLSTQLLSGDRLYIVESEYNDSYGKQIKNVGTPTEDDDAVTLSYVNSKLVTFKSLYTQLTGISQTSQLSDIIDAVVAIKNALSDF